MANRLPHLKLGENTLRRVLHRMEHPTDADIESENEGLGAAALRRLRRARSAALAAATPALAALRYRKRNLKPAILLMILGSQAQLCWAWLPSDGPYLTQKNLPHQNLHKFKGDLKEIPSFAPVPPALLEALERSYNEQQARMKKFYLDQHRSRLTAPVLVRRIDPETGIRYWAWKAPVGRVPRRKESNER